MLGRVVRISGRPYTVVGVMPPVFQSYPESDMWASMQLSPHDSLYEGMNFNVVARLKSGTSRDQAQSEMNVWSSEYRREHPPQTGVPQAERDRVFFLTPYRDVVVGGFKQSLLMLQLAVALVLLIGCANVAGMLLARGLGRSREIAVRVALGATRGRLARLFLMENLQLSLLAGVVGIFFARAILPLLLRISPTQLPRGNSVHLNVAALLFALGVSVLAAMMFGIAPVARLFFSRKNLSLREAPRGAGPGRFETRSLRFLIVAQVGVAMTLLVGADLLLESFLRMRAVSPGFEPRNVMTFQVPLSSARYNTTVGEDRFVRQILLRLGAMPGVEAASFVSGLPLQRGVNLPVFPAGRHDELTSAEYRAVSSDYLRVLRIPLLAGRSLKEQDTSMSERVAVINQTMARRWWANSNPVGQTIFVMDATTPLKIVGVIGGVHDRTLDQAPQPMIVVPVSQVPDMFTSIVNRVFPGSFLLKTATRAGTAAAIREVAQEVDPELPVLAVMPMSNVVSASMIQPRFYAVLVGAFGALALLLTAVGLYGLISYEVARRTHEIGVRMALGARPGQVLAFILGRGLFVVAVGASIGIVGALAGGRLLAGMLFGIRFTDVTTFITVMLALFAVGALAILVPARRAAKVDPVTALRCE